MFTPSAAKTGGALLMLDHVAIRWGERVVFEGTCWTWRRGEQWAVLGPNGSGKSVLALALCGKAPLARGQIHYHLDTVDSDRVQDSIPEQSIALLSPHVQRDLAWQESSFYQSRWHSGIGEGQRTVAQFLSQASVEDINPFEVGARKGNGRLFGGNRRRFSRWLGIGHLFRRKLICLSNGEQRKVLLAHTLLRSPRLLILDDPFDGLDEATRVRLQRVVHRLMRAGLPVLLITNRPDELAPDTSHLLLVRGHRVAAQGNRRVLLRHPLTRQLALRSREPETGDSARSTKACWSRREFHRLRDPSAPPLVELNRVTIRLGRKRILDDVSWTMRRGENWALLGPNGSGKTALLSLIQGDNPKAYALDLRLFGARPRSTQTLWHMRRKIGWLSPELHQHYPPGWSCLDVACSGFFNTVGLYHPSTRRQRRVARNQLRRFGLAAKADEAFGNLSLGDQRLVLLARAEAKKPRLLILDEPCQGLDAAHRRAILAETDRLIKQTGASLIFVTHHTKEMPACITHQLELKSGRILRGGAVSG
jgi:molybdate transport system ATP-binding protein